MKVIMFEVEKGRVTCCYSSHPMDITEMERLKDYVSQLISDKMAMTPKGEVKP